MSRMYDRDPYAILRVSPAATESEVKEAYHKLARQNHPDVNNDPRAVERMKDINWAYDLLSDPQERAEYDLWRNPIDWGELHPVTRSPHSSAASPPSGHLTRHPQRAGCSQAMILGLAIMILMNVVLLIRPVSRHNDSISRRNFAAEATQIQTLESFPQTFNAPQGNPNENALKTPSPVSTIPIGGQAHKDLRSSIVRGSWEWDEIHYYFPELTTLYGLSDEVTHVTYSQRQGYHIKTRGLGDYWIYIDPYTHTTTPKHSPPAATVTP